MSLLGTGAVLIWNDIAPEGRADFYDWHIAEHMPERAAIPGFLRGRRYIRADDKTSPEFFTLYETASLNVLTSKNYLARLNAPTDWTKRATQGFRNTSRALTRVETRLGAGAGGVIGTVRFGAAPKIDLELLEAAAKIPRITGVNLCVTNETASAGRTAESKDRKDILAAPAAAILVEGCNEGPVMKAMAGLRAALAQAGEEGVAGIYRMEFECRG